MARITQSDLIRIMNNNPEIQNVIKKQLGNYHKQQNKYMNQKVYVYSGERIFTKKQNIKEKPEIFDSMKEYCRCCELVILSTIGEISNLTRQRSFVIQEKSKYQGKTLSAIKYKADFSYIENGKEIVEDVKAFDKITGTYRTTEAFNIKWKILKVKYPNIIFRIY